MKITLFWPQLMANPETPPLNIAQLGSVLKESGYDVSYNVGNVKTTDCGISQAKRILKKHVIKLEKSNSDILSVSMWFFNLPYALELIELYKSRNPEVKIIAGGYPPTIFPDEILRISSGVDYLVRGEGEATLLELVSALNKNKPVENINGISFRDNKNRPVNTRTRLLPDNLDRLPFPDYSDLLGNNQYESISLQTMRGCVYNCPFCTSEQMYGHLRTKSVGYVYKEIKHYIQEFNIDNFLIVDNIFTFDNSRTKKFCKLLGDNGLNIKWRCYSHLDTITPEIAKVMGKSGCSRIFYGVESTNPRTMQNLKKTAKPEEYVTKILKIVVETLEHTDVRVSGIVGFPWETIDEMTNTLNFMRMLQKLGSELHLGALVILPGSQLWQDYLDKKIELVKISTDNSLVYHNLFFEKYEHLPWCVPTKWLPKNAYVEADELEKFLCENHVYVG
ncbi:MAG: radical SAM protein [Candidatus Altiarchaeota archaeon]